MRDEMLKRLDDLMASLPDGWRRTHEAWAALRAELAAERCENCTHYEDPGCSSVDDSISISVDCDFCCSHFTKKELSK